MRKVIKISVGKPYILHCIFDNGENRFLDLKKVLDSNQKYARRIFDADVFRQAKIGSLGEIYWENIAEIKMLDGKIQPCNYDISPEFAYLNSEKKTIL